MKCVKLLTCMFEGQDQEFGTYTVSGVNFLKFPVNMILTPLDPFENSFLEPLWIVQVAAEVYSLYFPGFAFWSFCQQWSL